MTNGKDGFHLTEEEDFFYEGYEDLKELRDEIGPEEFSKITIDVSYNY